jgi:ATP-dependent DNA helicase 2 subunit 2
VVHSAIDALIVGVETQDAHLGNKKTWTRKIIIVTDGESPIEIEDWELTVKKMDSLNVGLTVVFVIYLPLVLPTDNL